MGKTNHYDVIISGSGAGGGTLAHKLAPTGKRILLLERGDYVPREKDNWNPRVVNLEGKYQTKEMWHDKDGNELHPHINYYVGGNTKFFGAALFRLRKEDFGEIRHHGGLSPAWPISYDDIEPYYAEAESLYHVHGTQGEDPTEPKRSSPYPHPAISHEPRLQQLSDDFERLGLRPFHTPLGVMLNEKDPHASRCTRCGFPCLVGAKSDAQVCAVDPALQHANVTLITNAYVERLEPSSSGREITKVIIKNNGTREELSGNIVVSSCGAINSAALLLRSANDKHPRGLANNSDIVGRHYMGHVNSVLMALSKCPNPTIFQKSLSVNDFYFGTAGWNYPIGHISFVGKLDGETLKGGAPALTPGWTLDMMAKHSLDFWLTSEDLPNPNNRVTLHDNGGIVLSYKPNNEEGHKRFTAKLKELMQQQTKCSVHGHQCHEGLFSRNLFIGQRIPLAGVAHQVGTVRFGNDPKTSALDVNCKAHDVDNLYVVDGSFFCSSGAVNPALTIMANALRVGEHLIGRMGRIKKQNPEPSTMITGNKRLNAKTRYKATIVSRLRVCLLLFNFPFLIFNSRALAREPLVDSVEVVGVTVADMDRSVEFFSKVLSFEKVSDVEVAGTEYERLQGVFGLRMRVVRMKLGAELIELMEYLAPQGRPIPVDSRSNDRWFQHIAIVVSDMDKAYQQLREYKVKHTSTGPQTFPASNQAAAGIRAFYFKDPDGHNLEIIYFPPGKGDPRWQKNSGKLFLGIDHTAIVVSDTERSLRFYRDLLGLRLAGESMNYGTEQEHLNNVAGARLRISGLRARSGPGIEFLDYLTPKHGRLAPADTQANDLWHWQTALLTQNAVIAAKKITAAQARFISSGVVEISEKQLGFAKGFLARDPDGHAIQLIER